MLHVSDLLLQHKDISTFEELLDVVKQRAKNEMFFRMDLKPPYPDTPNNWEMMLEAAFSSANESPTPAVPSPIQNSAISNSDNKDG